MSLTADRSTLLSIKPSLDPTGRLNWRQNLPLSDWEGVAIRDERVASLYLPMKRLGGVIPPEMGNLTGLQYLHLNANELTGTIPPNWAR